MKIKLNTKKILQDCVSEIKKMNIITVDCPTCGEKIENISYNTVKYTGEVFCEICERMLPVNII